VFEEYAQVLQQRYPQLSIHGANYPPSKVNQAIASVINTAKWAILGTVVLGEKVQLWNRLNVQPPSAYSWTQENKIISCLGVFFTSNSIEGALLQTGAFEVELNGVPIWSKLNTGRIPQGQELFDIINNQLNMSNKNDKISTGEYSKQPTYTATRNSKEDNDDSVQEEEDNNDSPSFIEDEFEEFNTDTKEDSHAEL